LLGFTLLSVAWIQWFAEPAPLENSPVLASRTLLFQDAADGAVHVIDAKHGTLVANLPSGEQGFVRATVRGLARARRARGLGDDVPFTLEQRASGQLVLIDPLTGQEIDLWAFGSLNARPFVAFLHADSSASAQPGQGATLAQSDNRSKQYDQ
jgi:putative photosynthetic complex assembly protein